MDNRKRMINMAMERMSGFRLEGSSYGDNRSIFGLIKMVIGSANGDTLADCRKPLEAIAFKSSRQSKFQGCKLPLLQKTIKKMFDGKRGLLSGDEFAAWDRSELLEYFEVCRRIFVSGYETETAKTAPTAPMNGVETKEETAFERAFRLDGEKKKKVKK